MEANAMRARAAQRRRGRVALLIGVALGLCLCVPAVALAVDASDGVATDVFRNGTEVDVYSRGTDNGIWERVYSDANGWSAPLELPGTAGVAASSPAADVFHDGT